MKKLLLEILTWWNGQTVGTRWHTWRHGVFVGEDQFGNRYYQDKAGARRWVTYVGEAEASRIPPGWHGWIHYRVDVPPTEEAYPARDWEKPHRPNLTGTPAAYRPKGSILTPEKRQEVTGDYEPWTP